VTASLDPRAIAELAMTTVQESTFVFFEPVADAALAGEDRLQFRIDFSSSPPGRLWLATTSGLGRVFAANMLGIEPSAANDEDAAQALSELANIVAGALAREVARAGGVPSLGLPERGGLGEGAQGTRLLLHAEEEGGHLLVHISLEQGAKAGTR